MSATDITKPEGQIVWGDMLNVAIRRGIRAAQEGQEQYTADTTGAALMRDIGTMFNVVNYRNGHPSKLRAAFSAGYWSARCAAAEADER